MDLSIQDENRDFSFYDANELFTIVCNKENLLEKKRRYFINFLLFGSIFIIN